MDKGGKVMDGLISRQATIEAIEEMQMPIMRSEFTEEQFVFTGMSEALSAIKELPSAQPETRWIPCSEPPTEHGFYHEILLYGKDGNYAVGWYDEDYFTWDDRFDMDTPVAWMPLPEPWRGEEHGE